MKALIQRVSSARVIVSGNPVGSIKAGLLVFIGIGKNDTKERVSKMADKIANLRIFEDADGKMNLSILEKGGEILLVSQFTLYGDCNSGNRPGFSEAVMPEVAEKLYIQLAATLLSKGLAVATGIFREHMQVELTNDGPATFMIEVS